MPFGKGKMKGKGKSDKGQKVLPNISAALVPTIAFTAVPKTPPPSGVSIEDFEPKLTSSLLSSSIIGRLYATQDPDPDSDHETTTSINDYLEPGNPTLRGSGADFPTWNRQSRQSEGPYNVIDEDDMRHSVDDVSHHVYAQVRTHQRPRYQEDAIVPEVEMFQQAAAPQVFTVPKNPREIDGPTPGLDDIDGGESDMPVMRNKREMGYQGPMYGQSMKKNSALDNVGTLITTDTQEGEDLKQMVDIMHGELIDTEQPIQTGPAARSAELRGSNKMPQSRLDGRPEAVEMSVNAKRGGPSQAERSEQEQLLRHLKGEVEGLKKTIFRLNVELARQVSPRSRSSSPSAPGATPRLPGRGPVPAWLVNTKFLSPLLVAYDEKLEEKEAILHDYDRQMREFEAAMRDVIKENERLHIKLEEQASTGPASRTEWQQFLEQAKLVLEENQLLLEQLDVQQEKAKAADRAHVTEVSRMSKHVIGLESQKDDVENELVRINQRFRNLKARYDQYLMEKENQEDDATTEIYRSRKIVEELKITQENEIKELLKKLETTQGERRATAEELADAIAERKKLEGEVRGLKKSLKEAHRKNLMLRKFLRKEESAQEYLDSVLQMAQSLAAERDNCIKAMRDKEAEHGKFIQNLIDEVQVKASIEANRKESEETSSSRKRRKAKSLGKLEQIVRQLLEQNEGMRNKHKEQEREVIYLQALVKEKEDFIDRVQTEKKHLEDQLETVWQAAINDNKQLRAQIIDTL